MFPLKVSCLLITLILVMFDVPIFNVKKVFEQDARKEKKDCAVEEAAFVRVSLFFLLILVKCHKATMTMSNVARCWLPRSGIGPVTLNSAGHRVTRVVEGY